MSARRSKARIAGAILFLAIACVSGGLVASPSWRMAALRLAVPGVPDAPVLPEDVIVFGSRGDDNLVMETVTRAAGDALRFRLGDTSLPVRLRTFRYAWPLSKPVGRAFSARQEVTGTLFGDMIERGQAAGWKVVEGSHEHYVGGSTLAFSRHGHTFGLVVGSPGAHRTLVGGKLGVVVPFDDGLEPGPDAVVEPYVPLFVVTDVFDPDGASFPHSAFAPFVDPESRVRLRLREANAVELVQRSVWEDVCGPGGSAHARRYAPCDVPRRRR